MESSSSCSLITPTLTSLVRVAVIRIVYVCSTSCLVEEGDRVAQLVIEKIETPSVIEVDVCGAHVPFLS